MEGIGINSGFAVRILLAIQTQKMQIAKQKKTAFLLKEI